MRLFLLLAAVALIALTLTLPATAAPPENPNCWGVVTSQLKGDVGAHAASFAGEPRLGLANVARDLGFDHISELGSFLATVDEVDATSCP